MVARAAEGVSEPLDEDLDGEQRVVVHGISWEQYEALLTALGDAAGIRLTYDAGTLEIMSPGKLHERYNRGLGRLLEAYAEERDLDLRAYGSATFRSAPREKGKEPDTCYVLGERPAATDGSEVDRPDLAIEITISRRGIDKLPVYAALGVPEVWFWRHDRIEVFVLGGSGYERAAASAMFPELDLELVATLAREPNQTAAVKKLRVWVRGRG